MARSFNRYLRGWLGLLDAKVSGQAPSEFSELIAPGLDAFPFIHAERREIIFGASGAVGGLGFIGVPTGTFRVPQGEIWFVDRMSVMVAAGGGLAAGEALLLMPEVNITVGASSRAFWLADLPFQTAWGPGSFAIQCSSRPWIGLPGDNFGAEVLARTVYAGAIDMALTLVRVPI